MAETEIKSINGKTLADVTAREKKLDKNQGVDNAGKILGVGEDGNVIPQDKPSYSLTDADKADVAEKVAENGIAASLVDMPSGGGKEEIITNNLLCETIFPANNTAGQEITCDITGAQLAQYKELHFIIRGTSNTSIANLYLNVAGTNGAPLIRMTAAGFYGIVRRDFENSNLVRAWIGTSNPSLVPTSPHTSLPYLYNTFTVGLEPEILDWTNIFAATDKNLVLRCASVPTIDYTLKIYGTVAMT